MTPIFDVNRENLVFDLSLPIGFAVGKWRENRGSGVVYRTPRHTAYLVRRSSFANERKGFGGYLSRGQISEGAPVRLRVSEANEILDRGHRLPSAYWTTAHGDGDNLTPVVARLPSGRGFLAGWTMGEGMAVSFESSIYLDATDAAHAAHSIADSAAEDEREREQAERVTERREELRLEIAANRVQRRKLSRELKAARALAGADSFPSLCAAIRERVEALKEEASDAFDEMTRLAAEPWTIDA
jgi:hypothetical protein